MEYSKDCWPNKKNQSDVYIELEYSNNYQLINLVYYWFTVL